MSVYTHHNLVKLFAEVKFEMGKYNPDTWCGVMPQMPNTIEEINKEEIYQSILNLTDKHFKDRKPKSWQSLAMQVALCLSTQNSNDLDQAVIETRGRNRMAAYCAGFLTMADIAILENLEEGIE